VRASDMDLDRYSCVHRWAYWWERRLSRFTDLVIANSQAGRTHAIAQGFPEAKLTVIANGIDTERFHKDLTKRSELRDKWQILEGDFLIAIVGRIDPMKGHPIFLKAAALLRNEVSKARFVCVGQGKPAYEIQMQQLARELNLDNVLTWVGATQDMTAIYGALDLLTSSSLFGEGFPNVLGEAMACELPCVATRVGDSVLVVGAAGIVVPPNDSAALCRAWLSWLDLASQDKKLRLTLGRDHIERHYGVAQMLDATEQTLAACVSGRTAGAA